MDYSECNLHEIALNMQSNVELVHIDYSDIGIYKHKTIFIWTFENKYDETVLKIFRMYPNTFTVFEPSRQRNVQPDKIILKINKTNVVKQIIEPELSIYDQVKKKITLVFGRMFNK